VSSSAFFLAATKLFFETVDSLAFIDLLVSGP